MAAPLSVVHEGRTYTFPPDSSDEEIASFFEEMERPRPTAPSRNIPERQANVTPERKAPNLAQGIVQFMFGDGTTAERGAGEAAWQGVPELEDQRFEGPLAPLANALPQPVRNYIGAEQRAASVGLGFFLNPNERSRAQIIKRQIPTAEFRRDAGGHLQVRYNSTRPWAYINKPGASGEDLQTFANEVGKYLVVRRFTGGAATAAGAPAAPLATSTAVEAGRGALTSVLGQGASLPLGAEEINAGDVAVSGIGSGLGNVLGHAAGATATRVAPIVADTARAVADVLPGGATRLAERQALARAAQESAEMLARTHAEGTVRAAAEAANLQGEALEAAIREAQENAVATVQSQFAARPAAAGAEARQLDSLARGFGVRLAKAQTEGDAAGMQFLYEAAGGMHGAGAQRQAAAFLAAQNQALPEAIKRIAGDASVTSPQAAVSIARQGLQRAYGVAKEQENAAWQAFDDAVPAIRTYDVTPSGRPGAVTFVRDRIIATLVKDKKMVAPEGGAPAMLPEFEATFPRVTRVLSLMDRMAKASKTEMPLRDVDRVVQLKRFIDSEWESADTDAERRLLTMMGKQVRGWLRDPGGGYASIGATVEGGPTNAAASLSGRGANVTHEALQNALKLSEQTAKTFRESDLMQKMLDQRAPMTDQELTTRLFGGGEGGLNMSSDSVRALQAMKDALGPSSPEWEALRQAALQRLTRGLDDAIATNQTPAILTTFKRIEEAFRRNREAMTMLFEPDELLRLREAQRVVAAMAPTARNPANPTNSGITAARAARGILSMVASGARGVPVSSQVIGAASDVASGARVNVETAGAAGDGWNIARRIAELWDVHSSGATRGSTIGQAYGTVAAQDPTYPPK